MHDRRSDLGRRDERRAVDAHRDTRLRSPLRGDRQAPVCVCVRAGDDPLGNFLLEHERERSPPWRPIAGEPFEQQRGPDIVRKVGNDVGALSDEFALVDHKGVAFDDGETRSKFLLQFRQRGNAAPIALDGDDGGSRIEQRTRKPAWARADFIDALALELSWNRCDPGEQLSVEDEVLPQRLARAQPMAGNYVAERFGGRAQGVSARRIAHSAAIRRAAAIGRGSARS